MKKIVRGNAFTLRVPVMKIVNGAKVAFPLPGCTDIKVNIVNQYRRVALSYTIDVSEDNVLLARVEGDKVAVGTYALEVKGKMFGNDWRSNEYEQFQIVDNNASGDTVFEPQEGEDSVEMDTALVVLAPAVELGNLIKDAEETIADTKEALKGVETKMGDIEQRADTAIGAATTAAESANTQAFAAVQSATRANTAAERAEQTNAAVKTAEQARMEEEKDRKRAEILRVQAEKERVAAEKKRASDTNEAIQAAKDATAGAEKVNAELNGNVLTVINRQGTAKSVNLTDADEHVTVNVTTTLASVSVEGIILNVYINNGADPQQYTTDRNGQATFTVTKGSTYKVVFPYIEGCAILNPVQHVAAVGNRIIDAMYTEETIKFEHVTVRMQKANDDDVLQPWKGAPVHVTIGGKKID